MKLLLVFLLAFHLPVTDLSAYRKMLDQSLASAEVSQRFYTQFKGVKENDEPILVGFKAMSEFMVCKHTSNPFSQLSHFNKGRKLLESAINRERLNPELLFFRLSTQSNIPSLLGYKTNINSDKLTLIRYLKKHDEEDKVLWGRIKTYLLINQYCTAEEKAMIRKL